MPSCITDNNIAITKIWRATWRRERLRFLRAESCECLKRNRPISLLSKYLVCYDLSNLLTCDLEKKLFAFIPVSWCMSGFNYVIYVIISLNVSKSFISELVGVGQKTILFNEMELKKDKTCDKFLAG